MEPQLYLFWSTISMAIFYLFYLVLLKHETFFQLNRIYLLSALFISMVLPLVDFTTLMSLPTINLMLSTVPITVNGKFVIINEESLDWLPTFYWIGVVLNATWLIFKLFSVKRQLRSAGKGSAYSFWNTKVVDQALGNFAAIDAHENIHVKQFHTADILLIELVGVFFWFNPLIFYYRRSIKLIHEYLADEHAARYADSKKEYAMVLFFQNFKAGPALTNSFYNSSLLEARINMLQSKKSKSYRLWKYALCMPLIGLITVMCSFTALDPGTNGREKIVQVATFPGGVEAFSKYLIKTTRKAYAKDGRVNVSFVVETDGSITNEKIEKSLDEASDRAALRAIKLSPKWKPALQNGIKVRSAYQIGINFIADNQMVK